MPRYTPEQEQAMDEKAAAAAKKEFDSDPIRKALAEDPKSTVQQDRVDNAVKGLRKAWGLDK